MFHFTDRTQKQYQIEPVFVVGNLFPNFMKTGRIEEVINIPILDIFDPDSSTFNRSRTVCAKALNKLGSRNDIDIYIYIEECKIKSSIDGIDFRWIKKFLDQLPILNISESQKQQAFNDKNIFLLDFINVYNALETMKINELNTPSTSPQPVITSPIVTVTDTTTIAPVTLPPPYTSPSP